MIQWIRLSKSNGTWILERACLADGTTLRDGSALGHVVLNVLAASSRQTRVTIATPRPDRRTRSPLAGRVDPSRRFDR